MLEKFLKRSNWTDIITSIIFVLLGALLIMKPDETVDAISIILGIVFIAMGALKLIEYYTSDCGADYLLTIALITVILGVVILFASDTILTIFRGILGIWILTTGIMDLQIVLAWKERKSLCWTVSLILAMLIAFVGIVILVNQSIIYTTMGVIVVAYGIFDIIDRLIFMVKIDSYI